MLATMNVTHEHVVLPPLIADLIPREFAWKMTKKSKENEQEGEDRGEVKRRAESLLE